MKDGLKGTFPPSNHKSWDLSQQSFSKIQGHLYGPRMISGLVKTKRPPLGAVLVKLCVSDSSQAVPG